MKAQKDPRVDAYIEKSADFAKPVLNRIRAMVHESFPDVEETIKWGFPFFLQGGILGGMSAFKQHCAFIFWKGSSLPDPEGILDREHGEAMGHLRRITQVSQLPSRKIFKQYLLEVVKQNENEKSSPTPKSVAKPKKKIEIPKYLTDALKKNKKALKVFEEFSPTNKKDYVEWLTEAKTEETRIKRLKTAVEWMSEGKSRNWKYMLKKSAKN